MGPGVLVRFLGKPNARRVLDFFASGALRDRVELRVSSAGKRHDACVGELVWG